MKRIVVLFLILATLVLLIACDKPTQPEEVVFLQDACLNTQSISLKNRQIYQVTLNEGYTVSEVYQNGLVAVEMQIDDMQSPLLGVIDSTNRQIIPYEYFYFFCTGNLIWGVKSGKIADIYNTDGSLVLSIPIVDDGIDVVAVTDEYFVVTDKNEKRNYLYKIVEGTAQKVLHNLIMFSHTQQISVCGKYLLVYDTSKRSYEIFTEDGWSPSVSNPLEARFMPQNENQTYKICYLGDDFLVNYVTLSDSTDYSYCLDGNKYYKCQSYIFSPDSGKKVEISFDYPVYDCQNVFEPRLSYYARKNCYLSEGYTYLSARVTDQEKNATSQIKYYIIDNNCNVVYSTLDINLQKLRYVDGNGVVTSTINSVGYLTYGKPLVLDNEGKIIWQSQKEVTNAYYNDGVYVMIDTQTTKYFAVDVESGTEFASGYDGLSPFVDGYAIGMLNNEYYQLDKKGNKIKLSYDFATFAYAAYYMELNSKELIRSFDDSVIVGEYISVERYDTNNFQAFIFVAEVSESVQKIFFVQ